MRTRYVKDADEIRRFQQVLAAPSFLAIRALATSFETEPAVLAELIPPPLKPAEEPRVSVYEIGRSNCVGPFFGASVNLACSYEGEPGFFCLTMPMSTDVAIIFGRELYAEPKKLAEIRLEEREGHYRGTVTRHGITYIELNGAFEDEPAPVDLRATTQHYYFKYLPAADGRGLAFDPQLVRVTHRGQVTALARGAASLTLRESPHDPVIDLPVLRVDDATFSLAETQTIAEVVATVPAADFMPYAFMKMDDLLVWAEAPVGAPA